MFADGTISAVLSSVERKLLEAGYAEAAQNIALRQNLKAAVGSVIAPPPDETVRAVLSGVKSKLSEAGYKEAAQDSVLGQNLEVAVSSAVAPAPDATINAVLTSVKDKLSEAGYDEAAQNGTLRQQLEAAVRSVISPPPPVEPDIVQPEAGHFGEVAGDLLAGYVVPFLGAGANLCGQNPEVSFRQSGRAPLGWEVADILLSKLPPEKAAMLSASARGDLIKASQFFVMSSDEARLFGELHRLFRTPFPITPVHDVLASVQDLQRAKKMPESPLLVVTTNYDTVMETAFTRLKMSCDVVAYIMNGEDAGRFHHYQCDPDGQGNPVASVPVVIKDPSQYQGVKTVLSDGALNLTRPLVLKLHGHIDVTDADRDSFVITQDHYIDFLARNELERFLPSALMQHLRRRRFLFLGYSLEDWNLRALLHFIWQKRKYASTSWAVRARADAFDRISWEKRDVKTYKLDLKDYMADLAQALAAAQP